MTVKELMAEMIRYYDAGLGDKPVSIMDWPLGKVIPINENNEEASSTEETTEIVLEHG